MKIAERIRITLSKQASLQLVEIQKFYCHLSVTHSLNVVVDNFHKSLFNHPEQEDKNKGTSINAKKITHFFS